MMLRWLLHIGREREDSRREVLELKEANREQRLRVAEALEELARARSGKENDD